MSNTGAHHSLDNPINEELTPQSKAIFDLPFNQGDSRSAISEEFLGKMTESLMQTVYFNQWKPSDANRHAQGLSPSIREGCMDIHPPRFWPPSIITKKEPGTDHGSDVFWEEFASAITTIANDGVLINDPRAIAELNRLRKKAITSIFPGYSVQGDYRLYLHYDAAAPLQGSQETTEEVQSVVNQFRELFRKQVESILKDRRQMSQIYKATSSFHDIALEVILQQDIELLESIRKETESLQDKKLFLSFMETALKQLDLIEGAEVDLLDPKDALLYGCEGLCKTEFQQGRAKSQIYVPMTNYYSGDSRSWDEALEILAHEAAHHQTAKMPDEIYHQYSKSGKSHDQIHAAWTHKNLQILRDLAFVIKIEDGEPRVEVARADNVDPMQISVVDRKKNISNYTFEAPKSTAKTHRGKLDKLKALLKKLSQGLSDLID